jgi:hypothetical protein
LKACPARKVINFDCDPSQPLSFNYKQSVSARLFSRFSSGALFAPFIFLLISALISTITLNLAPADRAVMCVEEKSLACIARHLLPVALIEPAKAVIGRFVTGERGLASVLFFDYQARYFSILIAVDCHLLDCLFHHCAFLRVVKYRAAHFFISQIHLESRSNCLSFNPS